MILIGEKIQQLNVPNKNKQIYLTETMRRALNNPRLRLGVSGRLGMPNPDKFSFQHLSIIDYLRVAEDTRSHVTTNLRIEDGWLVGDVEVLDTPQGSILKDIMEVQKMIFRLAIICNMTKEHIEKRKRGILVDHINIIAINAIPEDESV